MPFTSDELTSKRPDLLLLALKLFLLTHTSRHTDDVTLKLGLSPGETAILAQRHLEMDLVDGGMVLKLSAAEAVPVEVVMDKTEKGLGWKVSNGKEDVVLSAQMSPPEVKSWVKMNVSKAAVVTFRRAIVNETEAEAELGQFAKLPVSEKEDKR